MFDKLQEIRPFGMAAFLVKEDTPGMPKMPTSADTIILRKGFELPKQERKLVTAEESIPGSASTRIVRQGSFGVGSISIPTYLSPAGVAGSMPQEAPLLRALLGDETVNAGVSVSYKGKAEKDAYTLWYKTPEGDVFFCTGLVVGKLTMKGKKDALAELDWEGQFFRRGRVGKDNVAGALDGGETDIPVKGSAKRFSVGGFVAVGDSTNGTAGHRVTAIDEATDTITVTPAIVGAQLDAAAVVGLLPAHAVVGEPGLVHPVVKIGGAGCYWTEFELTLDDTVKINEGEVPPDPTQGVYPAAYGRSAARKVTGSVSGTMRRSDLERLDGTESSESFAIDGSSAAAGSRVVFLCAEGLFGGTELGTDEATVTRKWPYTAKNTASNGQDVVITFS